MFPEAIFWLQAAPPAALPVRLNGVHGSLLHGRLLRVLGVLRRRARPRGGDGPPPATAGLPARPLLRGLAGLRLHVCFF